MSTVYNKSAGRMERAEKVPCPRCEGAGAVFPRDADQPCTVCGGDGEVWMSIEETGWLRRVGDEPEDSDIW